MNRFRWAMLLLGISLAANGFLATAAWETRRTAATAIPAAANTVQCRLEEKRLRETLAALLCTDEPDRAAIQATFVELDAVRAHERAAALERFMGACARAGEAGRHTLHHQLKSSLCPWSQGEERRCAPSSTPGMHEDQPARPQTQGEKS